MNPPGATRLRYFPNDSTEPQPRVALDTGFLTLPDSGIRVYVEALRRGLPVAANARGTSLDLVSLAPPGPLTSRRARLLWELAGPAAASWGVNPDVLHIPHQFAPFVPRRPGSALVLTVHDMIPWLRPDYRHGRINTVRHRLALRGLQGADHIIVPSEAARADVIAIAGVPASRISVTPLAAAPEFRPAGANDREAIAAVRTALGIPGRYVFNVGGFDARKNLPALLHAFAIARRQVAERDPDLTLVIGGRPHSGNPVVFPPLVPLIREFGLEGRVLLPGRLTAEQHLRLHQGAAAYCSPSLMEGFGLTPLEALACGVPTIVANRTSLPEVVGDAGLLVEPDPDEIAAALVRVLTDDDLANALRLLGPPRAAMFSWQRTASLTLEAYDAAWTRVKREEPPDVSRAAPPRGSTLTSAANPTRQYSSDRRRT